MVGKVARARDVIRSGARLQRLVDDLGTTLLEILEAPGPLDMEVTGITIFDPHDDVPVSPGGLFLGVGVATEQDIIALIGKLGALGAAALVVKAPNQVSDSLRKAVHNHGIALLGLTRAASWFDVAILLRALFDRWTVVGHVHLGDSSAGDLFAVAEAVSALLDAPVTVEDRSSHVLAFSGRQDEADPGRIATILRRQMSPEHRKILEERGTFRELYRSKHPIWVPGLDHDTLPRVAVAVRAGAEVLGSLWVVVKEPLPKDRMLALTEAARLAALHILHQRNAADLSRQRCADLLESALTGAPDAADAAVRLRLPDGPLCVLACEPLCRQGDIGFESASQRLADALALHLRSFYTGAVVARVGQLIYAVVSAPGSANPQEMSSRLHAISSNFVARVGSHEPVVIGIGGPAPSLSALIHARSEAERTVRVLRNKRGEGGVARFEDVYLETILERLGEMLDSDAARPRGPVAKLLKYDEENEAELTVTLRAYLESFGDVTRAAATVHVHPNTFRYRLRRIGAVSGIDLSDPRAKLAALMQVATLHSGRNLDGRTQGPGHAALR